MSPNRSVLALPVAGGFVPTLGRRLRGGQGSRGMVIGFAVPYLAGHIIGAWADPLVPLALGAAFVTSVAIGRPLIAGIAIRRAGRSGKSALDFGSPLVQRIFARMTLVLGTVMLAEAGATACLVADHVARLATINTIVSLVVPAALIPVTVGYARRAARALASGASSL